MESIGVAGSIESTLGAPRSRVYSSRPTGFNLSPNQHDAGSVLGFEPVFSNQSIQGRAVGREALRGQALGAAGCVQRAANGLGHRAIECRLARWCSATSCCASGRMSSGRSRSDGMRL